MYWWIWYIYFVNDDCVSIGFIIWGMVISVFVGV